MDSYISLIFSDNKFFLFTHFGGRGGSHKGNNVTFFTVFLRLGLPLSAKSFHITSPIPGQGCAKDAVGISKASLPKISEKQKIIQTFAAAPHFCRQGKVES